MRLCKDCNENKEIEDFAFNNGYITSKCKQCFDIYNRERSARWYEINRDKRKQQLRNKYKENRAEVIKNYGGKCNCCGEDEILFLTMDHINNDGHLHRRGSDTSHHNIYGWLLKNKFPSDFQILCSNCNHGKHRNNGICPHKCKSNQDIVRST